MALRDKTVGHIHTDPSLIQQTNAISTLEIGQIVYLDSDGLYKPALAVDGKFEVAGVIWSFETNNSFYLMHHDGPCLYRFPLTPDFFNLDGTGKVDELSPNPIKIPGDLGDILYLSATIPGGITNVSPYGSSNRHEIVIGKKMKYGFLYQPHNACPKINKIVTGSGPQVDGVQILCSGNELTLLVERRSCCL